MREGCYELILKKRGGLPNFFAEEDVHGDATVIGDVDEEYVVCINIYRDETTGKWPASKLRIGLMVDGHDVQYSNRVYLSEKLPHEIDYVTAIFEGFKKNGADLRAFKFGTPSYIPTGTSFAMSRSTSATATSNVDQLGKIQAVIYKCARVGETSVVRNQSRFHELHSYESTGRERKAWLQPSLITKGGQRIAEDKERFPKELARWKNAKNYGDKPIKILCLNYHTKMWANLKRKLLDRIALESKTTSTTKRITGGHTVASAVKVTNKRKKSQ